MAIKSSDQLTILDISDAYNVILTSESHTFIGTTDAAKEGSCTTQIVAMRGTETVACSVNVSAISCPTGVTVTKDTNTTSPTLTIYVTTAVKAGGSLTIPVVIGDVTVNKVFSYAIAFTGATGAKGDHGTNVTVSKIEYQAGSSATTAPTGTWSTSVVSAAAGQYLWTKTTYSDGNVAYTVALQGKTGGTGATGKGVSGAKVDYASSTSNTTAPTSWQDSIPSVAAGSYLWTRTITTYTDNTTTTSYSVAKQGSTGAKGDKGDKGDTGATGDTGIVISITTSAGSIFKNNSGSTVLTAHVYQNGAELTSSQISALGTLKWYKDGSTTAAGTGATLTVTAAQVSTKATYTVQLEG